MKGKIKTKQHLELTPEFASKILMKHTIHFCDDAYKTIGSGIYVKQNEIYFILSAWHVVVSLNKLKNFNILIQNEKAIKIVNFDISKSNRLNADIGLAIVDEKLVEVLNQFCHSIPIWKITNHKPDLSEFKYCMFGYSSDDKVAHCILVEASSKKPYIYYKIDSSNCIIVNMSGKGHDLNQKIISKLPNSDSLHGLSGGGLWHLKFRMTKEGTFEIRDYELVGILTEYKKGKYYCIIANKPNIVFE